VTNGDPSLVGESPGAIPGTGATAPSGGGEWREEMSRFYGVKCDRCGEVLSAPTVKGLEADIDDQGWYSGKFGRSFVHYCEPCQEANEGLRQAILEKLSRV
jgi:hypothetical protein